MKIDKEKCAGCKACHPYCTTGAIFAVKLERKTKSEIDQDKCVECGACLRSEVCPREAIFMPTLEWPRIVRAQFGNPYYHPKIKEGVPPTPEMKVNDITGLIPVGVTEIAVELGRPGITASFIDVQTVCMALVKAGLRLHPGGAFATIVDDLDTGKLNEEILGERAMNVMIQGRIENSRLKTVLNALKQVAGEIDTVFSLSAANRIEKNCTPPAVAAAIESGFSVRAQTKTNIGLGRRLSEN